MLNQKRKRGENYPSITGTSFIPKCEYASRNILIAFCHNNTRTYDGPFRQRDSQDPTRPGKTKRARKITQRVALLTTSKQTTESTEATVIHKRNAKNIYTTKKFLRECYEFFVAANITSKKFGGIRVFPSQIGSKTLYRLATVSVFEREMPCHASFQRTLEILAS